MSKGVFDRNFRVVTKISSCRIFVVSSRGSRKQSWRKTRLKEKNAKVVLMLNFPFIYNFLEVELWGCDHDLRTMIEYFPLTVRYFIYSIPKDKCRPGHLNVNILNMAISHSLHLQSLHHQHQRDLMLGWCFNLWCQQRSAQSGLSSWTKSADSFGTSSTCSTQSWHNGWN